MKILRLSSLTLGLAIAIFALGYNPSFADQPNSDGCGQVHCDHGGGDPSCLTYTIELIGPGGDVRGAFEFAGNPVVSATVEDKGRVLKGDAAVTMNRPGTVVNLACSSGSDQNACIAWNDVFNVCGLLGQYDGSGADDMSDPTNLDTFTVAIGDWSVTNSSEKQWISFGFEIAANLSPPSSRPLSAFLQLSRDCDSVAECRSNIPTAANAPDGISFLMTDYSIHLTGKKGVTQQAECHSGADGLSASGSTLVITATAAN